MKIHRDDEVAKMFDEAEAHFNAWREANDPLHRLSMEEACLRYNRDLAVLNHVTE